MSQISGQRQRTPTPTSTQSRPTGSPSLWTRSLRRAGKRALEEAQERVAQLEDQTEARERAVARAEALAQMLNGEWAMTEYRAEAYTLRYNEVLADSKLVDIIGSIEPNDCQRLVRTISLRSYTLQEYWWFIQIITPITRLPPELLHQILLIIIDEVSDSPLVLMQVSRIWYTIVTGIWASLKLGTTTPKDAVTNKLERNQWFLDISVDTDFDRGDFTPSEDAEGVYDAIFAAIQATSRWRSFVVQTFPAQADLSEHVVNRHLEPCSNAVLSRLRTFKIKSACERSPLLDHLLHILGTSASEELTTIEIHSPDVISFLAPTYSSIFNSVKVLSLDALGSHNPVDLLPHLHQLEELTASHLSLPIYTNDVDLPLVHTLRHLTLRAVSVQWMSGRSFYALESCTLLFPLLRHLLHSLNTTLPNCERFAFQGYPLDILDGVSTPKLTQFSVTSPHSDKLLGNRQLVWVSSHALRESQLALRILHIGIEATTEAWIKALALMSNLEELVIESARPSSLGVKVLHSLVIYPVHANDMDAIATPAGLNSPICPSLQRFGLRYRRWLRSSEHCDLFSDIMLITCSRQLSMFPLQSFRIWKRSDQQDPFELIEGSWVSHNNFRRLTNYSSIHLPVMEKILVLLGSRGSHSVQSIPDMT